MSSKTPHSEEKMEVREKIKPLVDDASQGFLLRHHIMSLMNMGGSINHRISDLDEIKGVLI